MKHTQTKFFIMFLSGILFSVFTVFAATITVNTDFTEDAVQYLQSLVLTDSGGTTGIVLDGVNNEIHADTICSTNGNDCKVTAELLTGYIETDPIYDTGINGKICSQINDKIVCETSQTEAGVPIWNTGTNGISYMGKVGIGTNTPETTLDVNGIIHATGLILGDPSNNSEIIKINNKLSIIAGHEQGGDIEIIGGNANMGVIQDGGNIAINGGFAASSNGGDVTINGGGAFNVEQYGDVILANNYGKVGIGTDSPNAKLEVDGTVIIGNAYPSCLNSDDDGKLYYGTTCVGTDAREVFKICMRSGDVFVWNIVASNPSSSNIACGGSPES